MLFTQIKNSMKSSPTDNKAWLFDKNFHLKFTKPAFRLSAQVLSEIRSNAWLDWSDSTLPEPTWRLVCCSNIGESQDIPTNLENPHSTAFYPVRFSVTALTQSGYVMKWWLFWGLVCTAHQAQTQHGRATLLRWSLGSERRQKAKTATDER